MISGSGFQIAMRRLATDNERIRKLHDFARPSGIFPPFIKLEGVCAETFRPQYAFCMAPLFTMRYSMTGVGAKNSNKGRRISRGSLSALPENPARLLGPSIDVGAQPPSSGARPD